jgi:hypothetical protein
MQFPVYPEVSKRMTSHRFQTAPVYLSSGVKLFKSTEPLLSFDLGPAIVVEAGQSYSMNAYAAAIIWLLGVIGLFVWKKIGKFAKGTTSSYKS